MAKRKRVATKPTPESEPLRASAGGDVDEPQSSPAKTWMHGLLRGDADNAADAANSADAANAADAAANGVSTDGHSSADLPHDAMGLGLSGGGIRSASFCLGIIQSLARHDWLRHVDLMSTVSGGGYTGSFLGRFFDQQRALDDVDTPGAAQDRVATALSESRSDEIDWLRRHSNFLSPTGFGEAMFNFAAFWRNFLSLHFVLGVFFFAVFGIVNGLSYFVCPVPVTEASIDFLRWISPVAYFLFGELVTPWIVGVECVWWFAMLPLAISYWMVSQDENEALLIPVLLAALIVAVGVTIGFTQPHGLLVFSASLVWAYLTWRAIEKVHGHIDPRTPFRLGLSRNRLTYRLAFWTTTLVVLVSLALIDWIGRWLTELILDSANPVADFKWEVSMIAAGLMTLAPTVRAVAGLISRGDEAGGGVLSSLGRIPYVPTVLALILAGGIPLSAIAFASHLSFEGGYDLWRGWLIAIGAVVISLLLGSQASIQFVNRVGPLTIYAARLARVFLGAANPRRKRRRSGKSVTEVIEGDDVAFDQYRPHESGGPLHLINVAVNETVDVASQRSMRDRQAEDMAGGPAGGSLSKHWHGVWIPQTKSEPVLRVQPLGNVNRPHPFRRQDGRPASTERLTVRQWMAISGAAASPGMGRLTSSAVSLILTLANVRLGYWWNSGIWSGERANLPTRTGLWEGVKNFFMRLCAAQGLLISELRGQFGGPWRRHFYLSDGGNFENSATYELIRRRVPLIITCDAGRDHRQQLGGLAELTRIARVDFGAEIIDHPVGQLAPPLPENAAKVIGPSRDLLADRNASSDSKFHASLMRIVYPQDPGVSPEQATAWHRRRETWLLYIKATYTGNEPADVRNYKAKHPDFPDESTLDQFFDEPQWESYRKLGEHIGDQLFGSGTGAGES